MNPIKRLFALSIGPFNGVMIAFMLVTSLSGALWVVGNENVSLKGAVRALKGRYSRTLADYVYAKETSEAAMSHLKGLESLRDEKQRLAKELESASQERARQTYELLKAKGEIARLRYELSMKRHIASLDPEMSPELLDIYYKAIDREAKKQGIPPALVACMIKYESGYDRSASGPRLASGVQCQGAMQIHPAVQRSRMTRHGVSLADIHDIDTNIMLGCEIFREFYDMTGSIRGALRRYVGGPNTRYIKDVLACYQEADIETPR